MILQTVLEYKNVHHNTSDNWKCLPITGTNEESGTNIPRRNIIILLNDEGKGCSLCRFLSS